MPNFDIVRRGGVILSFIIILFFVASFWGATLPGLYVHGQHLFVARLLLPIAWLAALWLLRDRDTRRNLINNNWVRFALLWLAWAGISFFWAKDISQVGQHFIHLFFGLSLPLLMIPLSSEWREKLPFIWVGTAIVIIFIGAIQLVTANEFPPTGHWLSAVYGNENNFTMFICLSIPFLYWYGVSKGYTQWCTKASRFLALLSIPVGVVLIIMTNARLSYIGLAVLAILIPLLNFPQRKKTVNKRRWKHAGAAVLAVMLIASVFGVLSVPGIKDKLKRQIVSIPKEIKTVIAIDSTSPRARLTIEGIKMAINSRGLGVGPGNFEWHIANKSISGTPNPHNWWLELLAEYGLLVFIGYILIYIKLIISTFRRWKSDRYWPAGATLAALLVFPILAVAPSRLIWYSPHWLLLALAVSISIPEKSRIPSIRA
jgi:teichuronic acid biosynthesis protein TuaE